MLAIVIEPEPGRARCPLASRDIQKAEDLPDDLGSRI
jgi:hypothetical protein